MFAFSGNPAASAFAALLVATSMFSGPERGAPQSAADPAFALSRNAEIEKSISVYHARRAAEFAAERNREIKLSIARVKAARVAVQFAANRNAEIEQSIAAYRAARAISFAAERNDEILRSITATRVARAAAQTAEMEAALLQMKRGGSMSATGAIAVFERLASLR